MKTNAEKFNVNFVKLVQNYPCIWDRKSKYHRNKKVVRLAWQKISKQLNEPVENCPDRWRKIRDALHRSIKRHSLNKNPNRKKKPYYLTSHLQFLLHKSGTQTNYNTINSDQSQNLDSETEDCKPGPFLEETTATNKSMESLEISQSEQDSASSVLFNEGPAIKNYIEECSNNEQHFSMIDEADSVSNKQRKFNEEEDENDSDMNFFKSLLRDVRKMSDRQNRKFRLKVLQIIDEICDDISTEESSQRDHQNKNRK